MKTKLLSLVLLLSIQLSAQSDTSFFPSFLPYSPDPIIEFGDFFAGSPWNDPCVIKEGPADFVMYASATTTGIAPTDTIKIYKLTSADGYAWTLDPMTPVLEADPGTYYQAAVETPSVVKLAGTYHMYNTVYPVSGDVTEFRISHATSTDGINWTIDATPFLERDPTSPWMNFLVGEPGAMVKNDTIYVFFTTMSAIGDQTIGLATTVDGGTLLDTMNIVNLPTEVYPIGEDYLGLSTPSATMIGDTIYLFTDVAQTVLGEWTQVALHQFKSYGDLSKWYHDTIPIHTKSDFTWTDGNYLSEIRAITPLLDGNTLRIWYAGNNLADIDTVLNDTTVFVTFVGPELHANPGHWGIGTSSYTYETVGIEDLPTEADISIYFDGVSGKIITDNDGFASFSVFTIDGRLIKQEKFFGETSFTLLDNGIFLVDVRSKSAAKRIKIMSIGSQ